MDRIYRLKLPTLNGFIAKRPDARVGGCQCEGDLEKRKRKDAIQPWERRKRLIKCVVLVILWTLFIYLTYRVSQIEHSFVEYDPYKILDIDVVRSSLFSTVLIILNTNLKIVL